MDFVNVVKELDNKKKALLGIAVLAVLYLVYRILSGIVHKIKNGVDRLLGRKQQFTVGEQALSAAKQAKEKIGNFFEKLRL